MEKSTNKSQKYSSVFFCERLHYASISHFRALNDTFSSIEIESLKLRLLMEDYSIITRGITIEFLLASRWVEKQGGNDESSNHVFHFG